MVEIYFSPHYHVDGLFSSKFTEIKLKIWSKRFGRKLLSFDKRVHEAQWTTNLFDQIFSLMFVKDRKTVILMKKSHQWGGKKENKTQGFSKNLLLRGLLNQKLRN
jgi:hypothetical protein